jgi:general secretion pathway protein G
LEACPSHPVRYLNPRTLHPDNICVTTKEIMIPTACPYPAHSKRTAFTLVELLTVIAIFGVLAGILIAAIGPVRTSARKSRSLSNIRQIHQGLVLYDTENKKLPPLFSGLSTSVWARPFWNHRILPYLGVNMDPYNLSDPFYNKGGVMPDVFLDSGAPSSNTLRGDYGVNYHLTNGPIRGTTYPSFSLRSLVNPTHMPLVATTQQIVAGQSDPLGSWFFNNSSAPNGKDPELADRYNGNCLIIFADGHMAEMPRSQIYAKYLPALNN